MPWIQNAVDNASYGLTGGAFAPAGQRGNIITTKILFSSAVSLPNATPTTLLTTSIPIGNYLIWANFFVLNSGGSITFKSGYLTNSVMGALNDQSTQNIENLASGSWNQAPIIVMPYAISTTAASTQSVIVQANFSGTCTICGYMQIQTI